MDPAGLKDSVDWSFLFVEWDMHCRFPQILEDSRYGEEAQRLYADALDLLSGMSNPVHALYRRMKAVPRQDDIVLDGGVVLPQLRNQTSNFKCLADYIPSDGTGEIVLFAITTRNLHPKDDCYLSLLSSVLCDRLADAMITHMEHLVRDMYSLDGDPLTIAYGYPSAPDHSGKRRVYDLLDAGSVLDLTLSENYSMEPTSSVMGFIIPRAGLQYFNVGRIGQDQLEDYARRAGLDPGRLAELIPDNL